MLLCRRGLMVAIVNVIERNNVKVTGRAGAQPMLFAHGFGCDSNMWRLVAPRFEDDFRVIVFDHVGSGGSDLTQYDREKYSSLDGYASDVVEICRELDLHDVIFVGHSVSAMIGALASLQEPERFAQARHGRTLTALSQRRRLRRGIRRGGHPRDARLARQQLSRLVGGDGTCHRRQLGSARTRRRTHRELLSHRSRRSRGSSPE